MSGIRIELTGRLSVTNGQVTAGVERFRGRQGRIAFAYLASNLRRAVPIGELAGVIWPERLPDSWKTDLSAIVSRLRGVLTSVGMDGQSTLVNALGCYELRPDGEVSVDVLEARAHVAAAEMDGDPDLASAAAAIAGRDLLPGDDCPWLDYIRTELRSVRVRALTVLAEALTARGDIRGAIEATETSLTIDPLAESAYRRLIELHLAAGDKPEALRAWNRCRDILADELGINPGEATEAAYLRVLELSADLPVAISDDVEASPPADLPELPAPLRTAGDLAFVGRDLEVDVLMSRLHDMDKQTVVAIAGEAGVGKTRLASEFAARAHGEGTVVLYGRSDERSFLSYQPFAEALDRFIATTPDDRLRRLTAGAEELARLTPALSARIDRVLDGPDDRTWLFEAVTTFLRRVSTDRPVVLILEDMHWADDATEALLHHVVRRIEAQHLMILITFRDLAAESFAALVRNMDTKVIELAGLGSAEVASLFSSDEPSLRLARLLHGATDGNPFYLREMLRHLADTGAASERETGWSSYAHVEHLGLPRSVRDVIATRVERLSDRARQVLRIAAVIGPEFDLEVLRRVSDRSESTLIDDLQEAVDARIVTEVASERDRYAFTHVLIRQTLHDGVTASRRARLHRGIRRTLEVMSPGRVAELAHHTFEAGDDWPGAARYALEAGNEALAALAHSEAGRRFRRGLEAAEHAGADDIVLMFDLLAGLAATQTALGQVAGGKPVIERAIELARRIGDHERLARAALLYQALCLDEGPEAGHVDDFLVALFEESLVGLEDGSLRANVLARLALELFFSDDVERRRRLTDEAEAMARECGDGSILTKVLVARYYDMLGSPDVRARMRVSEEMAEHNRTGSGIPLPSRWEVRDLLELGDLDGMRESMRRYRGSIGVDWLQEDGGRLGELPVHRWHLLLWEAAIAQMQGRDDAEAKANQAFELGAKVRGPLGTGGLWATQIFAIRLVQGRVGELEDATRAFAADAGDRPEWWSALALIHADQGNLDEARALFDRIATAGFDAIPWDHNRVITLALLAWVCAALEDEARAASLYDLLAPYTDLAIVVGVTPAACAGSAADPLGCLALVLGRDDEAEALFERALEMDARLGAEPWAARTRARLTALRSAQAARSG